MRRVLVATFVLLMVAGYAWSQSCGPANVINISSNTGIANINSTINCNSSAGLVTGTLATATGTNHLILFRKLLNTANSNNRDAGCCVQPTFPDTFEDGTQLKCLHFAGESVILNDTASGTWNVYNRNHENDLNIVQSTHDTTVTAGALTAITDLSTTINPIEGGFYDLTIDAGMITVTLGATAPTGMTIQEVTTWTDNQNAGCVGSPPTCPLLTSTKTFNVPAALLTNNGTFVISVPFADSGYVITAGGSPQTTALNIQSSGGGNNFTVKAGGILRLEANKTYL